MRFKNDRQRKAVMSRLNHLNRTDKGGKYLEEDRIAVLSDIHGNAPALKWVLKDIRKKGIPMSRVFSTGDLVGYNKYPNEVVNLIRENGIKTVKGNHDFTSSTNDAEALAWYNSRAQEGDQWTFDELSEKNKEFLKNLPEQISVDGKARLVHGSPSDPLNEYLLSSDVQNVQKNLIKIKEDVLIVGHTHDFGHFQDKHVSDKLFVSAGSVGEPRAAGAKYAIVDLKNKEVESVEVPLFDVGIPGKELKKYRKKQSLFPGDTDFVSDATYYANKITTDDDWVKGKDGVWRLKDEEREWG